jgi:ABC-type polysaccharide/polyol phosphate export permease
MIGATLAATWAYRDLVRHLVLRDLRLKYKGSTLGFGWSLAQPLLVAAVYTIAFEYIVRIRIEHFALFLLSGLLPWTFFATALGAATASIVDNSPLIRKVAFPRLAMPLAAVLAQFVQFAAMYAVIVPAFSALEGRATVALAALVPIALLQLAFTTGLGLMLATAYVHVRDARHLLDVVLQLWFWLTPIVYALSLVPEAFLPYILANPMAWFITAYHDVAVEGRWPSLTTFAMLTALAAASALAGLAVFARAERRFAEQV